MPPPHDDAWLKEIQKYSPITDAQRAELQRVIDEAERRQRLGLPFDDDFLQAIADAFRGPLLTIRANELLGARIQGALTSLSVKQADG